MTGRLRSRLHVSLYVGLLGLIPACWSGRTEAASFVFSGTDAGGTGSATMDIKIVGNTLTLTLDNTSPTTLNSPLTGANAPGILGFGFNLADPLPTLISWALTGYADAAQTTLVTLGDSVPPSGDSWVLGTTIAGVTMDFLPNSNEGGVKGAIYNPAATAGLAALPNYFSTATLVMNFASAPVLAPLPSGVFVRMQNVGLNGAGSLKLFGTPNGPDDPPIATTPEPTSMAIFGIGLVGCSAYKLRRRRQRAAA